MKNKKYKVVDLYKVFEKEFADYGGYYFYPELESGGILIEIEGDWKHAHMYADYLMDKLGYERVYFDVTEEDGSDWYTAAHGYHRKEAK